MSNKSNQYDLEEGERELQLHFPARANPAGIKYHWSKNGFPFTTVGKRVSTKGPLLTITDATRDDRGQYSLRASNSQGSTELSFFINILCKLH